jgi:hypothetical protein
MLIRSTTHVLLVHKGRSSLLEKGFVHAKQDINLTNKPINVSVSYLSNHVIKQALVSVCAQKISQDGILLIKYVKRVLQISLLLIEQQAPANLVHQQLQIGIKLLINVRHAQKILILTSTYQNVSHVKMIKNTIKQQKNAFLSANLIKFTVNKKENVTLLNN